MTNESKKEEEPGLVILHDLQAQDLFSPMKPERLEEDLVRIKRQDLANFIKQYRKSEEFRRVKKQEDGKVARKGAKNRHPDEMTYLEIVPTNIKLRQRTLPEDRCLHMVSITFMHVLQSINQSQYLVEAVLKEEEALSKKKEISSAIGDLQRDFERINKSIKKIITATKEARTVEVIEYSIEGMYIIKNLYKYMYVYAVF